MVKITIENLGEKELIVNDLSKSILAQLQSHYIDWMHACGGKGKCTTCRCVVVQGGENFNPITPPEVKYRERNALLTNERLTCQTTIFGDVVIRVPEDCKLPHIQYTS